MAQYGKIEYWDERYTRDPDPFDWYQRWSGIRDLVLPHLAPTSRILVVGCGNSRLSEEMYEEGFTHITNVDISLVCIKMMQGKCAEKTGMTFSQMDVRSLEAPDGSFNIVLDKGTIDSILCGEGSAHNVHKALLEISRVLDAQGVYVCVSHGQPNYRMSYLQRPEFGWDVQIVTVAKPMMGAERSGNQEDNLHYVYICSKGTEPGEGGGE